MDILSEQSHEINEQRLYFTMCFAWVKTTIKLMASQTRKNAHLLSFKFEPLQT